MEAGTLVGSTLGHHTVLERLGEGGMGVVYKARDLRLGRVVAVKVLLPEALARDAGLRHRLTREACAASALNHPNIVTVYEIDHADGLDFIAMEYVSGSTLRDVIARGRLSTADASRIGVQVADALVAAHAAGIIHRDLKPSNIMVTPEGRLKIVDFGLAKSVDPARSDAETEATLTAPGTTLGTVAYMSPEQATGGAVDGRSDIFSVGCVLYELVSGHRPFAGESSLEVLTALLRDSPAPVSGVSPVLMEVVERCLQKSPARRYQAASDLKSALESCVSGSANEEAMTSVAVLPFANLGGAPDETYLSEGLAEAVINALTAVEGLRVIARTSAFAVADLQLDVREIGARLGVSAVLQGSVQRAGGRVRVTVRLVRAHDATHVWSERYDRELLDVLAVEDEIAAAVATRLRGEGPGRPRGRARASGNPEAQRLFLEGRYHFGRGGPEEIGRAKACFERALGIDDRFALACDSLAEIYWFLGFFGVMPPRDAFGQSTWYAMRALDLDDTLGETHALLGMLRKELDYNWPEVRREMERGLALNPSSPVVRVRNAVSGLMPVGLVEEALAEVTRAFEADPLAIPVRWWLACMHWLARRPERMVEIGRGMIELDDLSFFSHTALGLGLAEIGALEDAMASMRRACDVSGGVAFPLGFLGNFQARAGRRAEALETLARLRALERTGYLPPFSIALVHLGLGDIDEGFRWMDRAIDERDPIIIPIKSFPFLDPLRSDPRFTALLRKMNLD